MIEFTEIDSRLKKIGKNREWLAKESGRSPGAIRSALAKNADKKHRSELLQRALSDVIEREEAAEPETSARPALPPDVLVIELDAERYRNYSDAAKHERENLKEWTIRELDRAAAEWRSQQQQQQGRATKFPDAYELQESLRKSGLRPLDHVAEEPDERTGSK